MSVDTERRTDSSEILLLKGPPSPGRAYAVGKTETGKSTLLYFLMEEYRKAFSTKHRPVRTLIIDTKPRFMAEKELSGLPTAWSRRYAKWGYGSGILRGSFPLIQRWGGSIKSQLDQIWNLGGTIAIAHAEREYEWVWASECARVFYEQYGAKYPRLLFVDELADFFKYRALADIFQRVARNGRERNVALLAGSQRPRKVPVEVMTEMSRVFMFELDFLEDLQHLYKFGVPMDVRPPAGHAFYMWDRKLKKEHPSAKYYELSL